MRFHNPLESRTFVYKKSSMDFFCPLCRTKRAILTRPHLSWVNYLQISMISAVLIYFSYPIMKWRSFFFFFILWSIFEFVRRSLFRKEIPCPHCGFDASWYKRDVKMARQLVQEFWDAKQSGGEASQEPIREPEPEQS